MPLFRDMTGSSRKQTLHRMYTSIWSFGILSWQPSSNAQYNDTQETMRSMKALRKQNKKRGADFQNSTPPWLAVILSLKSSNVNGRSLLKLPWFVFKWTLLLVILSLWNAKTMATLQLPPRTSLATRPKYLLLLLTKNRPQNDVEMPGTLRKQDSSFFLHSPP